MDCKRNQCNNPATCAIWVDVYPPRALMEHYKTDEPLTRLVVGLEVCDVHLKEAQTTGSKSFIEADRFEPIARMIEQQSNVSVDRDGSKIVGISLDDPLYLKIASQRVTV